MIPVIVPLSHLIVELVKSIIAEGVYEVNTHSPLIYKVKPIRSLQKGGKVLHRLGQFNFRTIYLYTKGEVNCCDYWKKIY